MKKMYAIAAAALLVDQVSKYAVRATVEVGQSVLLIPHILVFTHERNTGAAFGILAGKRMFFIIASLVVIVLLVLYSKEVRGSVRIQVAFGLILGGALGNLADRVLFHWVTDFINFSFFPATFNLADSALVVGVALFALDTILEGKKGDCSET